MLDFYAIFQQINFPFAVMITANKFIQ